MDGTHSPRRIALLAGGESPERQVSLASGRCVETALRSAGHTPEIFDPAETPIAAIDWSRFDVCFLALHGGAGEDGRVQAELSALGVPYTGSRPAACRLAMDKSAAKARFTRADVATPPYISLSADESPVEIAKRIGLLGYPLVIKPNSHGSSLGVVVARRRADLARCLQIAGNFDECLLAERYVQGREFTVSILGRDPLPLIEIVPAAELFSYHAKYSAGQVEYRIDCGLPASVEAALYRAAISAAAALSTAGLVRVDLLLDEKSRPWVLEVNAIPGMTEQSLAPRAAAAAGIGMAGLVDWMVRDAWQRFDVRQGSISRAVAGTGAFT